MGWGWFWRLLGRDKDLGAVGYLQPRGSRRIEVPLWSFPDGLELQTELAPARWIEESLARYPWATVGSLLPAGFEAYARILHPAYRRISREEVEPVAWSEVARATGGTLHPLVQFARMAGMRDDPNEHSFDMGSSDPGSRAMQRPNDGSLPHELLPPLVEVLRGHTSTSDRCWFCVWHGFGGLSRLKDRERFPEVETPGRGYLLLAGEIDAVGPLAHEHMVDGPNIWWPEDHAWCVASEIDLDTTYVGGTRACIEHLMGDPRLEALPATIEDRVDIGSDTINPSHP